MAGRHALAGVCAPVPRIRAIFPDARLGCPADAAPRPRLLGSTRSDFRFIRRIKTSIITMPLNNRFFSIAGQMNDSGAGTENLGPLLYSLICMQRPHAVLTLGLTHTALYFLQALADIPPAVQRDETIITNPHLDLARYDLLASPRQVLRAPRTLVVVDAFGHDEHRMSKALLCAHQLGLSALLEIHQVPFRSVQLEPAARFGLVWIDSDQPLDFVELTNKFWPHVAFDGLFGMHGTYVDSAATEKPAVVAGPLANAVKRQLLESGMAASCEMISLLERHKVRQGSTTLLRKLSPIDRCRSYSVTDEQKIVYGVEGV